MVLKGLITAILKFFAQKFFEEYLFFDAVHVSKMAAKFSAMILGSVESQWFIYDDVLGTVWTSVRIENPSFLVWTNLVIVLIVKILLLSISQQVVSFEV